MTNEIYLNLQSKLHSPRVGIILLKPRISLIKFKTFIFVIQKSLRMKHISIFENFFIPCHSGKVNHVLHPFRHDISIRKLDIFLKISFVFQSKKQGYYPIRGNFSSFAEVSRSESVQMYKKRKLITDVTNEVSRTFTGCLSSIRVG